MKKSPLGIAICLIALSQTGLASLAQPAGSAGGDGVTNYNTGGSGAGTSTTSPSTTTPTPTNSSAPTNAGPQVPVAPSTSTDPNPDHFPWMESPKGAKPSNANANSGEMLKPETAAPAPRPSKADDVQQRKATPPAKATAAPVQRAASSQQPMKLFGRIEQIAGHSGASFPELRAMTPKLDPRGVQQPKRLEANQSAFSGKIVRSFPPQYSGLWGGNLQVQEMQIAPAYYSVDPQEAARTAQALKVGLTGAVNFTFQNLGTNSVSLEPANVMFMVPGKDTMAADQISQMMGGMQNSPMGAMMRNMANNMSVPLIMQFGNANTVGSAGETSLSGEQFQSAVMKNDIRQLEPGVLEQQIVTRQTYYAKKTNTPRSGYGETVIRFIWRGPTQMYVQAATVEYDASKRFLTKTVLGGYVQKGQAMNTDPMSSMQMPGMTIPGMMPNGTGMPNGLTPGGGIPGIDPNFMKQILGQ